MKENFVHSAGGGAFPNTRLTAIAALASSDSSERTRAYDVIAEAYWMPVYKYIRLTWKRTPDVAEDLTQSFFVEAIEKDFFAAYQPAKAKFRTFIRVCLDGFIANQDKAAARQKRGGEFTFHSIDYEGAESQLAAACIEPRSIDDYFEREWVRSLISLALGALGQQLTAAGKQAHFELFRRYVLEAEGADARPTYAELSAEFSLPVTSITNYLALARREFKGILIEKLRDLTASDEEFQREARTLFGIGPE